MTECKQAGWLGAYLDQEMPPAARAELEEHLRQCPACAAELRRLRELSHLLRATPWPEMPPGALGRLRRQAEVLAGTSIRRIAEVLTSVAAAIILVCCLWLWAFQQRTSSAEPISLWETTAVMTEAAEPPAPEPQDQLAQWIVQDLSVRGTHDKD